MSSGKTLAPGAPQGAGCVTGQMATQQLKLWTLAISQLVKEKGSASYQDPSIPNKPLAHLLLYINIVPWTNAQKMQVMTCLVHPDLKRSLKCSWLPVETTRLIKQGLAPKQLSKFRFYKCICTCRTCTHTTTGCSSLPRKYLLKSCIYYTHCSPIKGFRSH